MNAERIKLIFFALGCTLGVALFAFTAHNLKNFNPDDAALGRFTSGILGKYKEELVSDTVNPEGLIPAWVKFKQNKYKIILILGASQLHSVNHLKPTDRLAVMAMNAESERKGLNLRFLQLSRPNGNFHDALAQYLTFRALVGTPDAILVAVTYDDLREPGIQFKSFEGLPPLSIDLIKDGGPGISHIVTEMTAQQNAGSSSSAAQNKHISKTKLPHEILEDFIVAKMEHLFNSFKLRGKISAYFEWKTQDVVSRVTRNTSYKRSPDIPEQHKNWNIAALDSLFKVTRLHKTKLLFYKAPHPQGLPLFYHDRNDYDNFHNQLALRCKNEKVPYIDLEPIVPMQYWGLANGGLPDTFHFKGEGHEILATALLDFIKGNAHAF